MGGRTTHYQVLGISPRATEQQIRTAFRSKAKLYHPDHAPADMARQFHLIQAAYEVLCDPDRRRAYDESLRPRPRRHRRAGEELRTGRSAPDRPESRPQNGSLDELLKSFFGSESASKSSFSPRRRPVVDPSYSDEGTDAGRYKDQSVPGVDYDIYLSRAEAAAGTDATLAMESGASIDVHIPAGVYHGEVLSLSYAVHGRTRSLRLLVHVR